MKANYSVLISAGSGVAMPVNVFACRSKRPRERLLSTLGWAALAALVGAPATLVWIACHLQG